MEIEEANALVTKGMIVILSCKTTEQLEVAIKYADLIYKELSKEIGLVNDTNFSSLIEHSIGYAQCQIKHNNAQKSTKLNK